MNQPFLIGLAIFVEILLFLSLGVTAYLLIEGVRTVPWVRTHRKIAKHMLAFANYIPTERVLDLGCGDGTIVLTAAAQGGGGVGLERVGLLVLYARLKARMQGCSKRTQFEKANIYTAVLPEAQVITSYLFPEVNTRVEPRLREAFPPGTRVVSRDFQFPTLRLVDSVKTGKYNLFLYEI